MESELRDEPRLRFLVEDKHGFANGSYFGIYVPDTEAFARFMEERGIEVNPHEFYDCASLTQFGEFAAHCPCARHVSDHLARLPSFPTLTDRDLARMIAALRQYAAQLKDD